MLLDLSLHQLSEKLKNNELTVMDLVEESLSTIQKTNPKLHSYITVREKTAIEADAKKAQELIDSGKSTSILTGIPFSMKDAYVTENVQTTAASKVLENFIPPYNATVYEKLQEQGAILIGKNNQDAWGHGGSTQNTDYEGARNPWDTERVPGGSSGGSAIAVATRSIGFAIGEDTGGSIRNPSSMCNTCGLKPTYGRVSRYGAIAYASSLDTVGPMAKSVADIAHLLEAVAGNDPKDATSSKRPTEKYSEMLGKDIKGKVLAIPKEFLAEGIDSEVKDAIQKAAKEFEQLGAKIVEATIPSIKYGISIYYLIALSETSSNLGRYDGIRFGNGRDRFTPETMKRIMIGSFALSAGYSDKLYKNAQKARTLLIKEYTAVLETCDAILAPVTPSPAAKMGEMESDPLKIYLDDLYTVTVNLVGVPSLAIPAGFTKDSHLPIGMQIIGKKFHEGEIIQLGDAYQQVTDWHTQMPPVLK